MTDKTKKTGAGLLAAAALATAAFLTIWEPDKGDPGLVYADKLAGGLPTVCNGITKHITDTPVTVGERWSPEKCRREELMAIGKVQSQLLKCFTVEPPVSVLAMATSHAWNNGAANTCSSLAMTAWRNGDWETGCRRLSVSDSGKPVWSYVKTGMFVDKTTGEVISLAQAKARKMKNVIPEMKFVQGLANRRQHETSECLEGLK